MAASSSPLSTRAAHLMPRGSGPASGFRKSGIRKALCQHWSRASPPPNRIRSPGCIPVNEQVAVDRLQIPHVTLNKYWSIVMSSFIVELHDIFERPRLGPGAECKGNHHVPHWRCQTFVTAGCNDNELPSAFGAEICCRRCMARIRKRS